MTYKLKCWSDVYAVKADLMQASASVFVDGDSAPFQTADFRHRHDNMRVELAAWLYRDTPDHDADFGDVAELTEISQAEYDRLMKAAAD